MISNIGVLESRWTELRGKVRQRWSALTEDDLTRINGQADVLVGLLQQKYGYVKERAESEVNRFIQEMSPTSHTGESTKSRKN